MELEKLFNKINELQEKYEGIIIEANGEITPEADQIEYEISALLDSSLEEVDSLYYLQISLQKEIEKFKEIKEQISNRINTYNKRLDKIKELIAKVMKHNQLTKLEGELCSISLKEKVDLVIGDPLKVPVNYRNYQFNNIDARDYTDIVELIPDLAKVAKWTLKETEIKKDMIEDEEMKIESCDLSRTNYVTFYKRGAKKNG